MNLTDCDASHIWSDFKWGISVTTVQIQINAVPHYSAELDAPSAGLLAPDLHLYASYLYVCMFMQLYNYNKINLFFTFPICVYAASYIIIILYNVLHYIHTG